MEMRLFEEWLTYESLWIVAILVGAAILPIISRLFMPQKMMQSVPPGSFGWPILGETFHLITCRKSGGVARFFELRRKKHGDIFKTQILFRPTVVITGVDAQKLFLSAGYKSFDAGNFQTMKDLFGRSSSFTVTGERHKRVKRAILGFLHGKALREYAQRVEKLTVDALAGWEGKEVIALNEISQLTFNIIVDILLSMEAGQETVQMREKLVLYSLGGKKLPIKLPGSSFYRALQARRELVKAVRGVVDQRKLSGKMYNDVLQSMLQTKDTMNGLSYDEIVDNIILMIFGGTDTTSTTLTRIIQFLAENPDEIRQLQEEHERVRRQLQPNQPLTWEAIKSMSYTYQVINEGLRLSRVGDALSRTAVKDLQFRGYTIPKGWSIFLNKAATEFNPQIFEEPLRFKPSRFENPLPPFTFIPFGGGARTCPGMELANLEMAVFLYHFVTKYRWRLKKVDGLDFTRIVPQPKNGLPIFVELV